MSYIFVTDALREAVGVKRVATKLFGQGACSGRDMQNDVSAESVQNGD